MGRHGWRQTLLALLLLMPLTLGTLSPNPARSQSEAIPLEADSVIYGEAEETYLNLRGLADLNADAAADGLLDYSLLARGIQQSQQDIMFGRSDWPEAAERDGLDAVDSLGLPYISNNVGSRDNDPFYGFRWFLDANGDGLQDLAVFAQERRNSEVIAEDIKIYYGGPDWTTPDIKRAAPQVTIVQNRAPQEPWEAETRPLAEELITGDFDGDGDQDLAVGSCHVARGHEFREGQIGTLRLYFSGENGPASNIILGAKGDSTLTGEMGPIMGCFEPFAGDFDGDGRDDILISGSSLTLFEGSYAAVILGREDWPTEAEIAQLADVRFEHDGQAGGLRMIDARDLDGDGRIDAVFEYGREFRIEGHCAWLGQADPPAVARAADCPLRFTDEIYLSTGDLDGDGHLDLLFQLPRISGQEGPLRYVVKRGPLEAGEIAIGEQPGSSLGDARLELPSEHGQAEWYIGDIDGDGLDDAVLVRSSATSPAGNEFAGRIDLLRGPLIPSPPTATPSPEPSVEPTVEPSATDGPTEPTPGPTATQTGDPGGPPAAIYLPLGLREAELAANGT